ncbi:hypothetical protein BDN67DRAFT_984906 [Paxillus ammoniavirescens]|nr:hypothetical protein BDN67DRAFT_984906 [Paxillus ammoniavirescens]
MTVLMPRRQCLSCTEQPCVSFIPQDPSALQLTSLCYCDHAYNVHAPELLTVPLPPKGGCLMSNCVVFATPMAKILIQDFSHASVTSTSSPSGISPSVPVSAAIALPHGASTSGRATPWSAPDPSAIDPAGTVNSCRMKAAANHRPGVTENMSPFGPTSRGNSSTSHTSTRPYPRFLSASQGIPKHISPDIVAFNIIFMPYSIQANDDDVNETYPAKAKLVRHKLPDLYRRLNEHHLIIPIEFPASVQGSVLELINTQILAHFSAHNLHLLSSAAMLNNKGSIEYEKLSWVALELSKASRSQASHLLKTTKLTTWEFTGPVIIDHMSKIAKSMKNPFENSLLFLAAPRFAKVSGPIPGMQDVHACFANHVLDTFHTDAYLEQSCNPRCFPGCPGQNVLQLDRLFDPDSSNEEFSETISTTVQCSTTRSTINSLPQPHIVVDLSGDDAVSVPLHASVSDWIDFISRHRPQETASISTWHISGDTVDSVTCGLNMFLLVKHSGEPLRDLPPSVEIGYSHCNDGSDLDITSLFMEHPAFKVQSSGPAIGSAIEKVVISQAVQLAFSDKLTWTLVNDEGFYCPSILLYVSEDRIVHLKACGSLCALHIFYLGQAPLPCSPFLLQWIIGGFNSIVDLTFAEILAPDTASTLAALPISGKGPFNFRDYGSNLTSLITQYVGVQPSQIPNPPSTEERHAIVAQVYSGCLLGSSHGQFPEHAPELITFHDGFNIKVSNELPSFASSIGPSSKPLLIEMYKCTIESAGQVLSRIDYEIASISETEDCDGSEDCPVIDKDTKNRFSEHFGHYLNGKGHPIHKLFNEGVISEAARTAVANNKTFRATQFMSQVSGSFMLPADEFRRIEVRFIKGLPRCYKHLVLENAPAGWELCTPCFGPSEQIRYQSTHRAFAIG